MSVQSWWPTAYIIASWWFGLCTIFDVVRQPGRAFRSAGHSKRLWLVIAIVGTVLSYVGIFVWLTYSIWIRRGVVTAGGRPRRKGQWLLDAIPDVSFSSASSQRTTTTQSAPPVQPANSSWLARIAPPSQQTQHLGDMHAIIGMSGWYNTTDGRHFWDGDKWTM